MTDYEKAVDYTASVLKRCGVTGPAVPMERICQDHGLRIAERYLRGRCAMLDRATQTIYIAPMLEERRAFYLAHELGHHLLPQGYPEISMNVFAACLVVPHAWVISDLNTASATALCARYRVTPRIMKTRLRLIGQAEQMELMF